MKDENLKKLVNLINLSIMDDGISHEISNPQYSSLYLRIFLDEANDNELPYFDSFSDSIYGKIHKTKKYKKKWDDFRRIWQSWTDFYVHLNKNGLIK